MPYYHQLGAIPPKRHTQFKKSDGSLYHEEVMGLRGFSGIQTILYREFRPTSVIRSEHLKSEVVTYGRDEVSLEHHHLVTKNFCSTGDSISARNWLMGNQQVLIGLATPTESMQSFFRNATCDELLFVHHGSGIVKTQFGDLPYRSGDYVILPVGTTFQIDIQTPTKFLVVESTGRIEIPRRYRNEYGQLLEHSPYCERDIRIPRTLNTRSDRGEFEVQIKTGNQLSRIILDHHPFDVVGWDGYLYPWIFNIADFEPITGRVHQPPPVHQTFSSDGFVVCSFVPRLYDYHPLSIPVPYNHSNVNSDEVLYYVDGNFMSRRGIDIGSFTHHPAGIPHGPHPGTVEASLGQRETKELAVMIDTFAPLRLTTLASQYVDESYMKSWVS